jgi:hypothetical protein
MNGRADDPFGKWITFPPHYSSRVWPYVSEGFGTGCVLGREHAALSPKISGMDHHS